MERQGEKIDKPIQGILTSSGKRVLLVEFLRDGAQFRTAGPSTLNFMAFECLMADAPFPAGVRPEVSSMTIDLAGLHQWLQSEPIKVKLTKNTTRATYTNRKNALYKLDDETLQIKFQPGIKRSTQVVSLSDQVSLIHTPHRPAQLVEQQSDVFGLLNDFLILLTGSNFSLPHPILKLRQGPPCQWYLFQGPPGYERPINWSECWTTFPQIRTKFGALWRQWVHLRERLGPGIYLYLGTLRRNDLYPEHRFVNLVWGMEAFHRKNDDPQAAAESLSAKLDRILEQVSNSKDRKWLKGKLKHAHEPSLADRISSIVRSLPLEFDRKAVNKFADECARLRNLISHFGGEKDDSYLSFVRKLEMYSEALALLYHCLILHEIGVDPNHLQITKGPRSYVIRQQFIAVGLLKARKSHLA
ncbi:hypothetical protein ACVIW0_003981 [Bradyrhizobium sp. USDA 4454]